MAQKDNKLIGVKNENQVIRKITTPFTNGEIEDFRTRLVDKFIEYKDLCDNKKAMVAEFKEEIDLVSAEIDDMVDNIKNECEYTDVLCNAIYDWEKGIINYVSIASGKTVDTVKIPAGAQRDTFDNVVREPKEKKSEETENKEIKEDKKEK